MGLASLLRWALVLAPRGLAPLSTAMAGLLEGDPGPRAASPLRYTLWCSGCELDL